jgi:phosphatidylglycerophosphatase C
MKKVLALFDFDGTISILDSTQIFYKFLYKSKLMFFFYHYVFCIREILFYRLCLISYLKLKEKRLKIHTSRFNDFEFSAIIEEFYLKEFFKLLNPKAIDRVHWHKNRGHEVWIISGSYDFILEKWSSECSINLIANNTSLIHSKRCIQGNDVNFEEKVERLCNKVDLNQYSGIYAYGDSKGDMPMLNIANFKYFRPFRK